MRDSVSPKPPGTLPEVDRRLEARFPVRPVEYIEIGENNGGLILDICEHGVAVSSANRLGGDQALRLRFQLPGFPDIIETAGEISWIGEPRKRAGIRFVDLPESAREQIQRWISLQNDATATQEGGSPALVPDSTVTSQSAASSEQADPSDGPRPAKNGNSFAKMASPSPVTAHEPAGESGGQEYESAWDTKNPQADRRTQVRKAVNASSYLRLQDGNAGLVANVSETGLSFRAAKSLESDRIFVRFQLPDSDQFIESPALIVWKSASKKKVGARFVSLSDDARKQIVEWLGSGVVRPQSFDPIEQSSSPGEASEVETSRAPGAVGTSRIISVTVPSATSHVALDGAAVLQHAALAKPAVPFTEPAPLPAEPTGSAKLELASFLAPRIAIAPDQSASARAFAASSSGSIPESVLPPVYKASSWHVAPRKSNGFWKIAALMILIGGICFGGGIFFSRNRQAGPSPYENANPVSDAADAPRAGQAERSGKDSVSQPSVIAPVTASGTEGAEGLTRYPSKQAGDKPVAGEQRKERLVDQSGSGSVKPAPAAFSGTKADRALSGRQAPGSEFSTAREKTGTTPAGVHSANQSVTAAAHQENVPAAAALATGETPKLEANSTHNQNNQVIKPAAQKASDLSPSARTSPAAVSNIPAPAALEKPVGSVSFFLRFRTIRTGSGSSLPAAANGLLQIGSLRSNPMPAYPVEAQRQQVQGFVELDVMVGSAGEVQSVRLVKGPPELAGAAQSAVSSWQFAPTLLGGHPVETEQSVIFTFKVGN
jgi:TonB family protein